ncbi:MAG: Do family serine endopeptidase [Gemmataceae bacterium]|nr:Do family serine endopeptidase [Gemmataceae bacterium]
MKRWSLLVVAVLLGGGAGSYVALNGLHGQTNQAPPVIARDLISYRDIVKKVLPAVVSIEAKAKPVAAKVKPKSARPPIDDPRIPEEFRRFFEDFGRFPELPGVPQVGFGSGFFIDPKGVILTNYHVVAGADTVHVTLHDGRKFVARDIHGDRRTDLAVVVLDVKNTTFAHLEFGDSDKAEIGDRVLAVGAPFGLTGSVTHGIVSAKGRSGLQMNFYEDFIQTDAAINPGNSGGPLVTLDGKVIGINAAIKSRSGGFQGVGLAVASNLAKQVARALQTDGVVHRGYLGVSIRDLDPEVAQRLGVPDEHGVVIGEVQENTPAAKGGLQAGDIVTSIAGKRVKDGKTLQGIVANLPLKQRAAIKVIRDGKPVEVQVVIEEQPKEFGTVTGPIPRRTPPDAESAPLDKLGLEVADLTDDTAESFGFRPGAKGVVITKVEPGSLADDAGLRRGMAITKIDQQRVASVSAAQKSLDNANLSRGVLLQVLSPQGGINFVLLKAAETE